MSRHNGVYGQVSSSLSILERGPSQPPTFCTCRYLNKVNKVSPLHIQKRVSGSCR